jgi:hypothetical protein
VALEHGWVTLTPRVAIVRSPDGARQLGCAIVLSTARSLCGAEPNAAQIGGQSYAILDNGAIITDLATGEMLHKATLTETMARDFVRVAHGVGLPPDPGGRRLVAALAMGPYCGRAGLMDDARDEGLPGSLATMPGPAPVTFRSGRGGGEVSDAMAAIEAELKLQGQGGRRLRDVLRAWLPVAQALFLNSTRDSQEEASAEYKRGV